MKIVVAVRCRNESPNIERLLRGYDFADHIVISDGGSTDGSFYALSLAARLFPKIKLIQFKEQETVNGETWNLDAPHMNFVINAAKELEPDWLIFDDFDCVPNVEIKNAIPWIFKSAAKNSPQINAFRLYMWGEESYFPLMNNYFDPNFASLWAWKPKELDIRADESVRHGTLVGLSDDKVSLMPPMCLLHKSWNPKTIRAKIRRYNALGLAMEHPLKFAGKPEVLPEWAVE